MPEPRFSWEEVHEMVHLAGLLFSSACSDFCQILTHCLGLLLLAACPLQNRRAPNHLLHPAEVKARVLLCAVLVEELEDELGL